MSLVIGRCTGASAVRDVGDIDPLELVETIREGILVLTPI
jgi:hypothetical protein